MWLCFLPFLSFVNGFCENGIGMPSFAKDNGTASVDVIVVQAALLSINPKIGQLFGRMNWYHTALVFKQIDGAGQDRYWTLEFDATVEGSTFAASVPAIDGDNLTWGNTDARFCLTDGILWGRDHWKKSWDTAMSLTAAQARRTFREAVAPINASQHGEGPQYQLFAVEATKREGGALLLKDMTCGDGVSWFLYYASTLNHVAVRRDFRLRTTRILFKAKDVVAIDSNNPEWHSVMVRSYNELIRFFSGPILTKPLAFVHYVPARGLYDTNSGVYYRIHHHAGDFVHFEYVQVPICATPWSDEPRCLQYLPVASRDVVV